MGAGILGLILFVVFGGVVAEEGATTSAGAFCSRASLAESFLQADGYCSASGDFAGVAEGDEGALKKALHLLHKNKGDYVALLFYASWCPFSKICRPNFNNLAMSFPNVHHFAFEESAVKPSILSRLGVHSFPTLFLLNSTVRVRYHGPRTTSSLVAFYSIVTGNNPIANSHFWESIADANPREFVDFENCPFSWAISLEKLLQQDTYLVLATVFLVARFLYFLVRKFRTCFHHAWRRHIRYTSLMSLCQACLEQGKHALSTVNHCKSQNGAINARAWASKSLASVSIGEPSSGRVLASLEMK